MGPIVQPRKKTSFTCPPFAKDPHLRHYVTFPRAYRPVGTGALILDLLDAVLVPRRQSRPQARRWNMRLRMCREFWRCVWWLFLVLFVRPGRPHSSSPAHRRQLRGMLCRRPPRPRAGCQDIVQRYDPRGAGVSFQIQHGTR